MSRKQPPVERIIEMHRMSQPAIELDEMERELLIAYQGQVEALFAAHITPVQNRIQGLFRRIEARIGLPPGSFGTTHQADPATGAILPIQTPPAAPTQALADVTPNGHEGANGTA